MRTRSYFRGALLAILIASTSGIALHAQSQKFASGSLSSTIPVTTPSKQARQAFEKGWKLCEELLYVEKCIESFRASVKADPNFALGHAALAYFTDDPGEAKRERALAARNSVHAPRDERLFIRWLNGVKNGELVPAIAAMNDLLAKYPDDHRLANLDSEWLCSGQQNFERGAEVLENLLKKDPKYFPALNNLAYCYALDGKVSLSPPLMERYVIALPGQSNPQDSFGEILRMSGDFQGALEHYHASLKIDSHFAASQVGIATTYALMAEEEQARAEYLKAVSMTNDRGTKLNYLMLRAMTYYRENQPQQARKTYTALAAQAHAHGFPLQEAEIYRAMALFNTDPASALQDLDAGQAVLFNQQVLSHEDHNTELASLLQARAYIGARAKNPAAVQQALIPLIAMAQTSRNNLIQMSYHSATGAQLFLEGKFADAISELQYDPRNPLSLELLTEAQKAEGSSADSQKTLATLAAISDERVETAVAAPGARAALKAAPAPSPQQASNSAGLP
ncbi:MAG: hypothetical protein WBP79_02520 [Candidatus Acidiferrales bacterium]